MRIKRHQPPVTITTVPRSTLEHVHHREIDATLKDLKLCSRLVKSALDSFRDELRTLERLYYKCKNQHRTALFFRRVPEMRRYGQRLSEMDILAQVDLLRASFVDLEHTNSRKVLRSFWDRVPEKPYISFLTERLTACSTLVCRMRECLEKACYHFTLAMQSGAFVQLIILFVAISSRMSVLSSQLEGAFQLGISTCNRFVAIIHPTGAHATIPQQSLPEPETLRPSRIGRDLPSKNTGQPISHCAAPEMRTTTPPSQFMAIDHTTARAPKRITARAARKPRLKKAKKPDEIDEIFGSSQY